MKTLRKTVYAGLLCGCLCGVGASAQTMIEGFEYASDDELLGMWYPSAATISLSSYVAPGSSGTNSLKIERLFTTTTWDTETITGPSLAEPMSIGTNQFITFRVAGDPQFTNATFQTLFLYAFDGGGNWGRWGSPVPTTGTNWEVLNFEAGKAEKPWDSPGPLDLSNIIQFKLYLYGQGDPAGTTEYPVTMYVDDFMVRDSALVEFPPASPMRALLDDFEGYADDAALLGAYTYENGLATTITTASLVTPAPQGNKALKLAIDFGAGQYPWGSVRSQFVEPFSFPTNAVVQFKFKGDPALAPVADDGTAFWLSFYDQGGRRFTFSGLSTNDVTSGDWISVKANYADFWFDTAVDTGNLVQWRLLVEGWKGTTDSTPVSGSFYVDDVRIVVPIGLSIVRDGGALTLQMNNLTPGTTYTVRQTTDFSQWTTATSIQAASSSATWTIPAGQKAFYQVSY